MRLILTPDELIACNTGRAFSPAGLRAICAARLSDKVDIPFVSGKEANSEIHQISEAHIQDYIRNPLRLREDAENESALRDDYGERVLLELLQNADDAMGDSSIGFKGIGFKSVLSLSDSPRLYSESLSVEFDSTKAKNLLIERGISVTADKVMPTLRLPFAIPAEKEDTDLIEECRREFSTVIVLPFRSSLERQRLHEKWNALRTDPGVLVLLHQIAELSWEDENGVYQIRCNRHSTKSEVTTCLTHPDQDKRETVYHLEKGRSGRGLVAFPIIGEKWLANGVYPELRCFFPIQKEVNPFPRVIMHGDFGLSQNRETILDSDADTEAAIAEIAATICALAEKAPSLALLLDILMPGSDNPSEFRGVAKRIWDATCDFIGAMPVPNCQDLKIGDLRLFPEGPYFRTELWEDEKKEKVAVKKRIKNWLRDYRLGGLDGIPFTEEEWESPERELILQRLVPESRIDKDKFQALPLFPVEAGVTPVSPSDYWLCFPAADLPETIPSPIRFRFVSSDATKAFKKDSHERRYLQQVGGIHDFNFEEVTRETVLPFIRVGNSSVSPQEILQFLFWLSRKQLTSPLEPDPAVDWRRELSSLIQIPTSSDDQSFSPAALVYAGKEWTGRSYLNLIYGDRAGHAQLEGPPEEGGALREAWESLYRWLGVAFCPRVVSVPDVPSYEDSEKREKAGILWDSKSNSFPLGNPPDHWKEYCEFIADRSEKFRNYFPRLQVDWMLDASVSELASTGTWETVLANWDHYSRFFRASWSHSSKKRVDRDNARATGFSYLFWCLRTIQWVPVQGDDSLKRVTEVYRNGGTIAKDLGSSVPVTATAILDEVAEKLLIPGQWPELNTDRWRGWLDGLLDLASDQQDFRDSIGSVYRAFLDHAKIAIPSQSVWTEHFDHFGEIKFRKCDSRSRVFYHDRSDLIGLNIPDIPVFPVKLGNYGKKALLYLGIEPLSANLEFEIISEEGVELDSFLSERLGERLPHLALACCGAGADNEESRNQFMRVVDELEIRLVDNFVITLRVGNIIVASRYESAPFFHDPAEQVLWLTEEYALDGQLILERAWGRVAGALVMATELSAYEPKRSLIANILRVDSDEDLFTILRDEGISEEELEHVRFPAPSSQVVANFTDTNGANSDGETESSEDDQDPRDQKPTSDEELSATGVDAQTPHASPNTASVNNHTGTSKRSFKKRRGLRSSGQNRAIQGKDVEIEFCTQLRKELAETSWFVPDYATIEQGRETDVVLSHPDRTEMHLEVKSLKQDEFFWSAPEIEQARLKNDRYWLVLIRTHEDNSFIESDVFFIPDPLSHFANHEKQVRWHALDERYCGENWQVSAQGLDFSRLRYSFKIKITGQDFKNFQSGFSRLKDYLDIS